MNQEDTFGPKILFIDHNENFRAPKGVKRNTNDKKEHDNNKFENQRFGVK